MFLIKQNQYLYGMYDININILVYVFYLTNNMMWHFDNSKILQNTDRYSYRGLYYFLQKTRSRHSLGKNNNQTLKFDSQSPDARDFYLVLEDCNRN